MHHAKQMGLRIAALLFAAGVVSASTVLGCSGEVTNSSGAGGNGGSGTTASSTSSNGSTSGAPMCPTGNAPQRQCYTLDQIENQINNPFPGGDVGADGGTDAGPADGGVMLTECPEPSMVMNGCCNKGVAGPEMEGDTCCYYFCEGACCGRPFTIEGQARLAETMDRNDWCAEWSALTNELDEATKEALFAAWRADAQMEHASVASFARFTLQLLALGAPADVVMSSQSASLDEIEHARLCFALASRFSGRAIGPAPLDMTSALPQTTLAECAGWTVIEGCIGETIAALTARAQLDWAEDEEVRAALLRIAEDEEKHAAVAWRFVAWALSIGDASVQHAVEQAFAQGVQQVREHRNAVTVGIDENAWHHFGRLTANEMDRVAWQALDEAIVPNVALLMHAPELVTRVNQPATEFVSTLV